MDQDKINLKNPISDYQDARNRLEEIPKFLLPSTPCLLPFCEFFMNKIESLEKEVAELKKTSL